MSIKKWQKNKRNKMIKMYKYSARAEAIFDADRVYPLVRAMSVKKLGDAQNKEEDIDERQKYNALDLSYKLEFDRNDLIWGCQVAHYNTPLTLDEMRYIFETVTDTHVMVQSINHSSNNFNGNRYYEYDKEYEISDSFKSDVLETRKDLFSLSKYETKELIEEFPETWL
jgi:hypothetical protein